MDEYLSEILPNIDTLTRTKIEPGFADDFYELHFVPVLAEIQVVDDHERKD